MNQVEIMMGVWQLSGNKLSDTEWQARRKRMREELERKKSEAINNGSTALNFD